MPVQLGNRIPHLECLNGFSGTGRLSQIGTAFLLLSPVLLQAMLVIQRLLDWQPVWAIYPDPGYQYLFAGGSIITGGTTDLIYHPGTSFQWFIGLSQVLTHLIAGEDSLKLDIATRPELYAQTAGLALTSIYVLALGVASWRLFKYLGLWPAVLFQLLLLWGLPLLASGRFLLWPESLLLTAAIASLALITPQLSGQQPLHPKAVAISLGIVAAVGMTAKITYLPIVILLMVILTWRIWAFFLIPLVSASLLIMIPVYSRLDSMQSWFIQITTSPGRHGQAGAWNPVGNLIDSMLMLDMVVRWFLPVALIIVVTSLAARLYPRRVPRQEWIPAVGLLGAIGIVLAAGLKASEVRDFIVVIPLLAALAAVTFYQLLKNLSNSLRKGVIAAIFLLGTFLAAHGIVQESNFSLGFEPRLLEILRDARAIDELNDTGDWASGYNAWTLDSARVFGLIWSAGSFNSQIREINPDALHFDLFSREILHVTSANLLEPLSCYEMQEKISDRGLGIIVENQNHLVVNDEARIVLSNSTAGFQGPEKVGRYFAYRLTDAACAT